MKFNRKVSLGIVFLCLIGACFVGPLMLSRLSGLKQPEQPTGNFDSLLASTKSPQFVRDWREAIKNAVTADLEADRIGTTHNRSQQEIIHYTMGPAAGSSLLLGWKSFRIDEIKQGVPYGFLSIAEVTITARDGRKLHAEYQLRGFHANYEVTDLFVNRVGETSSSETIHLAPNN